ncbi:MAG: sigma-70 family RNA polymerase sigma factor [Rhodomicrobium sp.]|nr:sigma-70 family RNA polymerase sigma factor [Rhodomicrobium sp.]
MNAPSATLRADLVKSIPSLRAFAISLCHDRTEADDLVQETLIKAWNHLGNFEEGTNLKAWLFTILRNNFYNGLRKRKHQTEYERTVDTALFVTPASQDKIIEFADMLRNLRELPDDQREALILVTVENLPYEEVAAICGCPVGTIKSRVNRARARLEALMNGPIPKNAVNQ